MRDWNAESRRNFIHDSPLSINNKPYEGLKQIKIKPFFRAYVLSINNKPYEGLKQPLA